MRYNMKKGTKLLVSVFTFFLVVIVSLFIIIYSINKPYIDITNSIKNILENSGFRYSDIEIVDSNSSFSRNIYIRFQRESSSNFSKIVKETYCVKKSIEKYFEDNPLAFKILNKKYFELCIIFSDENHQGISYSNQYDDRFNEKKIICNKFNNIEAIHFCRLSDLISIEDMESIVFCGIDNSKNYGDPMYTMDNINEIESSLQKFESLKYASLGIDDKMYDKLRLSFPTVVFV